MKSIDMIVAQLKTRQPANVHSIIDSNAEDYKRGLAEGGHYDEIELMSELTRGISTPRPKKEAQPGGRNSGGRQSRRR